jgi:predicted enzyme related to lactoylglutathione lyase
MLVFALGLSGALGAASLDLPPLTSVAGSPHIAGKFVWADLVTDDVRTAAKFYGRLFGWTFRDLGGYVIASNDERPLGGLLQRSLPGSQSGAKPRWIGYISVDDVEQTQRLVAEAGGRAIVSRLSLPRRGDQALFADPEGALFGVIKSASGDPQDFLPEPGDWIWMELISRDARKAGDFYQKVAGYEVLENTDSPRPGDYVFTSKGYARAAALTLPQGRSEVRPSWLPFVRVKSVGYCIAEAPRLGGKVLIQPKPELLDGKVAVLADPTGAAIGIMEWSGKALNGGR